MKIVHELNQLDFGGVERVIRNIIKFDEKNEHTVLTYSDGPYRKELESVGAKIHLLSDAEDEFSADVVHVHSGGGRSNMAAHLGGKFPIVETIHSPIRSTINDAFVTQRVGVTRAVSRLNRNCTTVKNGLDFSDLVKTQTVQLTKKQLGIPPDIPVIGRLGRIGYDKGLEEWLLVCRTLQSRGMEFIPLIVGGEARGAKGYFGKLKLMAECMPVENVVFAGHRTDVANVLSCMDVFLYPSMTEGFGLVFAEAMFCGAVVVANRTEVTHEVIGGYSVLVDPGKGIRGLAEAVEQAMNPIIKDELKPLAAEFVVENYSAQRMSEEYGNIYERSHRHFNGNSRNQTEQCVSC